MRKLWPSLIAVASLVASAAGVAGWNVAAQAAGNTLVFDQAVAITSLSPEGFQPAGYPSGYEAAFAIYNGLVQFNAKLQIVPSLATGWHVSNAGRVWTFYLRHGVRFQDGTPFNASDVAYDFNRMINPADDTGALTLWGPVVKVAATGEYTVQITTKTPYAALLDVLAHGSGLIPSPAAMQKWGANFGLHPVGTGPYMLSSFQPGTQLVLKANPHFWGGTPKLSGITFNYVPDPQTRIAALQSGQADLIDGVLSQNVAQLNSTPGVRTVSVPGLQSFGISLDEQNPILASLAVRRALEEAIDVPAIIRTVYGGQATALTSPLAGSTPGHVAQKPYPYNPAQAKALLAKAGWKPGGGGVLTRAGKTMAFTMLVPDTAYANGTTAAQAVASELGQIGVKVNLKVVPTASFFGLLRQPAATQEFQMALWGFNPSFVYGGLQMADEFTANATPPTSPPTIWDFVWYNNSKVSSEIAQANATIYAGPSRQILGTAQSQVWNDAVYLWLYAPNLIIAERQNVQGVVQMPDEFTLLQNASMGG